MSGRHGSFGTHLRATALVGRSAVRLARLHSLPFDVLAARLRSVPSGPCDRELAWACARVAHRLLPVLPPWGWGPCLKRALLLLDPWTRCGVAPRLHLGVRLAGETPAQAHAWLTGDVGPGYHAAVDPAGHPEAFVF